MANINNIKTGNVNIPGALHSTGGDGNGLVGGVVAYAGDIYDATLDKNLAEVNSDLTEAIGGVNDSISSIQDDISPLTGSLSLQYLAEYDKLEVYEGGSDEHNEVYIDDKDLAMNFGCNNTISNDRKLAFGFGQQLNVPDNTFVIGQRNSYEPNAAFIVGNGTLNGSTNNAFVIGRDGNFWVYGINGYTGQYTGASRSNSVNDFISDLDTRLTALEDVEITAGDVTYDSSETYTNGTVGNAIQTGITASAASAAAAASSASDASGYYSDILTAMGSLGSGEAVAAQVAINQADIVGLKSKTDSISKQSTESEEDAIVFTTDGGAQVGKIDSTGADFINLKRGGQQVARMSDLPTVPTLDTSIGSDPSNSHTPSTKAVKDYVDAAVESIEMDLPITEEATISADEEMAFTDDVSTQTYAKVGSYGIKSKAYLDMSGNNVIPTKDTSIGETPSQTNVPTSKAVADYVSAHGGGTGDLPISKEDAQSNTEEQIWANEAETDTYAKIGNYGIKAKAYYDLNDNPIGGSTQPLNVVAMLPSQINIVEGQNIYICPDSILNNVFANDVHIKYDSAFLTDRTAFNLSRHSTNETVGSHAFNMKIYDKNWKETNDINITVNTISKDVAGTFKICVIGDSKTDNATKLAQLLYLAELDGNLNITFLGSHNSGNLYKDCTGTPHPINREGYSGRNISEVCTSPTLNNQTNIFYDANITGNIKFSFAAGVAALNDVPDILWIDHGANQSYNWTNNKKYYDAIIASVAAYNTANNTNVKVVISLQERFGMSMKLPYAARGDENDAARRPTQESYNQMIEDLEGRESEGVFICPQYLHIDLWNDFPLFEAPVSELNKKMDYFCADTIHMGCNCAAYDASTTYTFGNIVRKGVDMTELYCCVGKAVVGVEPNDDKINWSKCVNTNAGYYKIADMYYATLKYIASLTN